MQQARNPLYYIMQSSRMRKKSQVKKAGKKCSWLVAFEMSWLLPTSGRDIAAMLARLLAI